MRNDNRRARQFLGMLLFGFAFGAQCHGAAPGAGAPAVAVNRGLQFLQRAASGWRETRHCAACHHAPMMLWTFNEAKAAGYHVDEKALQEVSEWAFGDRKTDSLSAEAPPRDVVNLGWVYVLLSMETAPGFTGRVSASDTQGLIRGSA